MAGVQEEEFDEGEVWDVLQDYQAGAEATAPRIAVATPPRNRSGKKAVSEGARSSKAARPSSAPVAIPAGISSSRRRGDEPQEDEDGGEMLPPHEWLARKMARMGGGRSKEREMMKVRDAVLPKTAFSEQ